MSRPWTDDPIAFVAAAAERLAPLGVQRVVLGADGGLQVDFYERGADALLEASPGAEGADEMGDVMEREPTEHPCDDPTTYGGHRVPRYKRPPSDEDQA